MALCTPVGRIISIGDLLHTTTGLRLSIRDREPQLHLESPLIAKIKSMHAVWNIGLRH